MDYNKRAKQYIQSLIRQRQRMIDMSVSRKNHARMLRNIEILKNRFEAYRWNDDRRLANFYIRNKDLIKSLVPGKTVNQRYKDYFSLLIESYNLINTTTHAHCA